MRCFVTGSPRPFARTLNLREDQFPGSARGPERTERRGPDQVTLHNPPPAILATMKHGRSQVDRPCIDATARLGSAVLLLGPCLLMD